MPTLIRNRQIVDEPSPPDLVLRADRRPGARSPGGWRRCSVIAVNFPKYGDGRGYSIARLLRERYGYQGELRAIGVVARDHLHAMAQCGFDAFQLREGEDAQDALAAFDDFSEAYQASAAQRLPLVSQARRALSRPPRASPCAAARASPCATATASVPSGVPPPRGRPGRRRARRPPPPNRTSGRRPG